ncbi:MAG TPA: hypothetical protein VLH60_02300 [Sedimentisphaerales bacterium]|nr:hypothetical protein [Sedimentisphaerales bacterium]
MRPAHFIILPAIIAVSLTGCAATVEEPPQSKQVRIGELAPLDARRRGLALPPAVNLMVVTYAIPSSEYERAMQLAMALLNSGPGILRNPEDFRANGFAAATGGANRMNVINDILQRSQATLLSRNYYAIFDDKGNDVEMAVVPRVVSIPYTRNGVIENVTLRGGQLAFRIAVRRFRNQPIAFRISLDSVWKPRRDPTFVERTTGIIRETVFASAGIETAMQIGEMILIGASAANRQEPVLADMFMTDHDRGMMKMVIVMCTGISQ